MATSAEEMEAQLELIEQNITLTLQQIDHNFAACYNTVATKLLPQIDRYGELSNRIWESSSIWLKFFKSLESIRAEPDIMSECSRTPTDARSVQLDAATSARSVRFADEHVEHTISGNWEGVSGSPLMSRVSHSQVSTLGAITSTTLAAIGQRGMHSQRPRTTPSAILDHHSGGSSAMEPPSLNFPLPNAQPVRGHSTPAKASMSRIASTPQLLSHVLSMQQHQQKQQRQQSATRGDNRSLDEMDLSSSGDESMDNNGDSMEASDQYMNMNSPPVTLQFKLPTSNTLGGLAAEAASNTDAMSPLSDDSFNGDLSFVDRVTQALPSGLIRNNAALTAAPTGRSDTVDQTSDVPSFTQRYDKAAIAGAAANVAPSNLDSHTASEAPSFTHRYQSVPPAFSPPKEASDLIDTSAPPPAYPTGAESPTASPSRVATAKKRFVTGFDDIDSLLSMPDTPVADIARQKLVEMDNLPTLPADVTMSPSRPPRGTAAYTARFSSGDMLYSGGDPSMLQPQISSTPMVAGEHVVPSFATVKRDGDDEEDPFKSIPTVEQASQHAASRHEFGSASGHVASQTLPAFNLDLFPAAFQTGPGSEQLQQVYITFKEHSDRPLDINALDALLPSFGHERISLLVDLLFRRRFLSKHKHTSNPGVVQWSLRLE